MSGDHQRYGGATRTEHCPQCGQPSPVFDGVAVRWDDAEQRYRVVEWNRGESPPVATCRHCGSIERPVIVFWLQAPGGVLSA